MNTDCTKCENYFQHYVKGQTGWARVNCGHCKIHWYNICRNNCPDFKEIDEKLAIENALKHKREIVAFVIRFFEKYYDYFDD